MKPQRYGQFELLRPIATGGLAEVFLARAVGERGFSREFAVKRLLPHLHANPEMVTLFQLEARLLACLRHPAFPEVLDLGFAHDAWYMAMQYIDAPTLTELWRRGAKQADILPMPASVAIVLELADALHHAHGRTDSEGNPLGIVHRDVSPENVLVDANGSVRLIDFGIATSRLHPPRRGDVGTPGYMAPEQASGQAVDSRADIFALGILLHELTTGARLFGGDHPSALTALVDVDAPSPRLRNPEYPRELEAVVMRALARDPNARFQSAEEMAQALEGVARALGWPVDRRLVATYASRVLGTPARRPDPADGLDADTTVDPRTLPEAEANAGLDSPSQIDWPTPAILDFAIVPRTPVPRR